MRAHPASVKRKALRAVLAVVGLSVVVAIIGLLLGADERLLASCGVVVAGCVASLLAAWAHDQGRLRGLLVVAFLMGVAVVCATVGLIWMEPMFSRHVNELAQRTVAGTAAAVVACILSVTALNVRFRVWWWHTVPTTAVALVTFLAGVGVLTAITPDGVEQLAGYVGWTAFSSSLGVAGMAAAASLLALPIMKSLDRMPLQAVEGGVSGEHLAVPLRCPRCSEHVELRANQPGACTWCGLQLRIEVQEPRCACGYLLHHLQAPVCPECGALVPLELNWRSAPRAATTAIDPGPPSP